MKPAEGQTINHERIKNYAMKKIVMLLPVIMLFTLLNCSSAEPNRSDTPDTNEASSWATAAEMNKRLGRGINIGNTFEAMPSWQSSFDPEDFKRIAGLGFSHVRIPVRWERDDRSTASTPYTIYPEFLKTIQSVVDAALDNHLHIIMNMHHHDALTTDPEGQKARFLSQWEQIAGYFKDYPDSLLFEILNEPHTNLTAAVWNDYSKEALQVIRKSNPNRCVLLGTAEWGGVNGLKSLDIPNDPHLILTIHYYNPFQFTHQGASWAEGSEAWLGTMWHDTEYERKMIEEDFRLAKQLSEEQNIPVHIGEFGAFSQADMASRARWTRYLSRWFEQQNFSWAYWEWNASFGIFDPITETYRTELVDALLKDPIPDPIEPTYTTLYSSNFTNGQNDGWDLYNNDASASSDVDISGNNATITIRQPGTEEWHIQFIKHGISIEKGRTYLLRVHAYSPDSDAKNIRFDLSKAADPWTSYAGEAYTIHKKDTEYLLMFTASQTDTQARLVFSFGNAGISGVVLSGIQLQEVTF